MMFGLMLMLGLATQSAKAQYDDVSLQTFYDELSPYGIWINDPQYGYVWRPDVDQSDFRPYYTNGRWVMTEYGNTWVSNYDWGWAPFHYGRWIYTRYNRWVWIPDTQWGPAWVSWRSGGGYYGWAPMGPTVSININIGSRYIMPDFCWNFIPVGHIYYSSFPRYYGGRNKVYVQNTVIINNTYIQNNRTYYTGPRVADIRRATNQNVTVYNISRTTNRNSGNSVVNNQVNIYTPRPNRSSENVRPQPNQIVQGNVNSDRIANNTARVSRGNNNDGARFDNSRGMRNETGKVDNSNISRGSHNAVTPNDNSRPSRGTQQDVNRGNANSESIPSQDKSSVFGNGEVQNPVRAERNPRTIMVTPPRSERNMSNGEMSGATERVSRERSSQVESKGMSAPSRERVAPPARSNEQSTNGRGERVSRPSRG